MTEELKAIIREKLLQGQTIAEISKALNIRKDYIVAVKKEKIIGKFK